MSDLVKRLRAGILISQHETPAVTLIGPDGDAMYVGPSTSEIREVHPLGVEAADALEAKDAEIVRLREALVPFVMLEPYADLPDEQPVLDWMGYGEPPSPVYRWTCGDFRRARQALAEGKPE